ncbi:MAG: hypothetical protein R2729_26935 [Bryobacteraceae bacterium]
MTATARLGIVLMAAAPLVLAQGRVGGRGFGGRGPGGGGYGGGFGGRVGAPAGSIPGSLGPIGQGFGNVVFPATGVPRVTGHIQNLGSTVRGVPYPNGWSGRGGVYPVAVPVAVPAYGYGYSYTAYPSHPQPQQPVTVINTPPPSPSVVINQGYVPDRAQPVMRDYTGADAPPMSTYQAPIPSNPDPEPTRGIEDDKPTIYLIAMRDGTVYSAYAYWVEGDTLHYITTAHAHNQASVSVVDSALSSQLNRERDIEFKLRK